MAIADKVRITVDLPDPIDTAIVDSVGRVWEVAINGQGYMLAENPEKGIKYERSTVPLDPPRLATSDTPFSEAIERYSFASAPDWEAGAGQEFLHREESTSRAYWDSDGVDPFTKYELNLLNQTEKLLTNTYASPRLAVVGTALFCQSAAAELKYTSDGDTWNTLSSITDADGAVTISDLTSDGQYWYGATGRSIVRGTTTNPAANWSGVDATIVKWAAGRICAGVKGAGSSTPNVFTTLTPTGVEERTNGHLTLEAGHTIVLGGATGGHFYFGAYSGDSGRIYAWPLGLVDPGLGTGLVMETPVVAWELPTGLIPKAVFVAGGSVWVHTFQPSGPSNGKGRIYRAVPSGGTELTPFFVTDIGATNAAQTAFAEVDEKVLFGWPTMATHSGLGAVSLTTGGYTKWLKTNVTGAIQSVVAWDGIAVWTISGSGVWADNGVKLTTGWLVSSTADGGSTLDKVWDRVTVVFEPLATGESIEVQYSIDGGNSFTSAGEVGTPGSTQASFSIGLKAPQMRTRTYLKGTTSSPTVTSIEAMYHPLGISDQVLVLPVNCSDAVSDLRGKPCPTNGDGTGARRARLLETMAQTRVKVQDIDWHLTGKVYVYEVVQVTPVETLWVYDQSLTGARIQQVVSVQLRKVGT